MKKEYKDTRSLRYGTIMIMTDQDHDGSHIKGLLINFIHHFWPTLLQVNGFLKEFITPIIKVTQTTRGDGSKTFFTLTDYEEWLKSKDGNLKGYRVKYYKGLGTSTAAEAKEYFKQLDKHVISFRRLNPSK